MRKQDLRKFDINLIFGILAVFCVLSIIFLLLAIPKFITTNMINLKTWLWVSYGIIGLVLIVVYIITREPKITWEKPAAEGELMGAGKYKLENGLTYMVKEDRNEKSFNIFRDAVNHGINGVCFTRENPKNIIQKHKLHKTPIIWLTEIQTENALNPTDVEEISYNLNKLLKKSKNSIILFDGLEYLINFLPFNRVMHLIQDIKDNIALFGSVMIIPVNEGALGKRKTKLLERELPIFTQDDT